MPTAKALTERQNVNDVLTLLRKCVRDAHAAGVDTHDLIAAYVAVNTLHPLADMSGECGKCREATEKWFPQENVYPPLLEVEPDVYMYQCSYGHSWSEFRPGRDDL